MVRLVAARVGDGFGQFEPATRGDGVDRRVVDRDCDDPGSTTDDVIGMALLSKHLLGRLARWILVSTGVSCSSPVVFGASGPESARCSPARALLSSRVPAVRSALPHEFHGCDVRDPDAVAELVATIVERHGRLDVVVNNAGVALRSGRPSLAAVPSQGHRAESAWHVACLAGGQRCHAATGCRRIDRLSLQHQWAAAVAGYGRLRGGQGGVDSLTATLAVEWAPKVRVNAVVAGMVATEQG